MMGLWWLPWFQNSALNPNSALFFFFCWLHNSSWLHAVRRMLSRSFWGGFLDPGRRTVTATLSPPRNVHLWWCSIRRRRRGLSPGNSISTLICLLLSVWSKPGLKENNCNRVTGRGTRARDCDVLHDCISPSTEYRYVVACMYSGFFCVYIFRKEH